MKLLSFARIFALALMNEAIACIIRLKGGDRREHADEQRIFLTSVESAFPFQEVIKYPDKTQYATEKEEERIFFAITMILVEPSVFKTASHDLFSTLITVSLSIVCLLSEILLEVADPITEEITNTVLNKSNEVRRRSDHVLHFLHAVHLG